MRKVKFLLLTLLLPLFLQSCCQWGGCKDEYIYIGEGPDPAFSPRLSDEDFTTLVQILGDEYTFPFNRYFQRVADRVIAGSDFSGFPYEITCINNSQPEAWSLPGGKVGIHRGLIPLLESEAELAAVIAHQLVLSTCWEGPNLICAKALSPGDFQILSEIIPAHVFYGLTEDQRDRFATWYYMPQNPLREQDADQIATLYISRVGYDPYTIVHLLERLNECPATEERYAIGCYSRNMPLTNQRIERLRCFVDACFIDLKGISEFEDFKDLTVQLCAWEPYYREADRMYSKAFFGAYSCAVEAAEHLICKVRNEAYFWGLLGYAHKRQGLYTDALIGYRRALELNPDYFDFYKQRGEIFSVFGWRVDALNDAINADLLLQGKISARSKHVPYIPMDSFGPAARRCR